MCECELKCVNVTRRRRVYTFDMTHSYVYVWRDSFIRMTQLIYMCDMTHLHVRHNSFTCATNFFDVCDTIQWFLAGLDECPYYRWHVCRIWYDIFIRVTWCMHMCDMTYSYIGHVLIHILMHIPIYILVYLLIHILIYILIHICDITWRIPLIPWTFICDMLHSHFRHDSFTCTTWLIHMCDMTQWFLAGPCSTPRFPLTYISNMTWRIHTCDMTW